MGINNIPPKICTYSCIYCQLGITLKRDVNRRTFYDPEDIVKEVQEKAEKTLMAGEAINYLTIVPDGEPTLDVNIGQMIELLRPFDIKIAVITNGSLIWREDVKNELKKADWVSLKVDSVKENVWHRINRPHKALSLSAILEGILKFAGDYQGELVTETMLVRNINDDVDNIEKVADFLTQVNPSRSYLAIPIRPPAEKWVKSPDEGVITRAYQTFSTKVQNVECLVGDEESAFTLTGNVEEDILSIISVHPMREEALRECIENAKADWSIVENLIDRNEILETDYKGIKFYIKKLQQ